METVVEQDGVPRVRLAPATRVVPGDQIVYTLEIRNPGPEPIHAPIVIYPVPAHVAYLADSASGPGAEVTFSVDGGQHFDEPENLRVPDDRGQLRRASAAQYSHIRWALRHALKRQSIAFARFRAVVR